MAERVYNRLRQFILEKQLAENRDITRAEIHEQTGIHPAVITGYWNNTTTRFDSHIIVQFCDYFNCDIGDFLYLGENNDNSTVDSDPEMEAIPAA